MQRKKRGRKKSAGRDDIRKLVSLALAEDIGKGDVTCEAVIGKGEKLRARIIVEQAGVLAGLDAARQVFALLDPSILFRSRTKDSRRVRKGEVIAELQGPARSLLTGERTALNFLQHLSGIATLTRDFVRMAKPYRAKMIDTRKTTPGWRILEKQAVRAGGALNHRLGLYDMVLIKTNHLRALRGELRKGTCPIRVAVERVRARQGRRFRIEVEATTVREALSAREAGADIIMLDNMSAPRMKRAIQLVRAGKGKKPLVEISGGVSLKNVRRVAALKPDLISAGALTHSAPSFRIRMEVGF